MAKKRKKTKMKDRPPCPDPEKYTWVETREGGYWRKKREAQVNKVLQFLADNTKGTNEAASRVLAKLQPFTQHLLLRRTMAKMAGAFKRSLLMGDRMDYTHLADLDLQGSDYAMTKLFKGGCHVKIERGILHLGLQLGTETVRQHSPLATGYFAEVILLWGDPGDAKSLRVDNTVSESFSFGKEGPKIHSIVLSIQLPARQPWIAMLKLSCLGEYVEDMAKYHAMKVVKVGNGVS